MASADDILNALNGVNGRKEESELTRALIDRRLQARLHHRFIENFARILGNMG